MGLQADKATDAIERTTLQDDVGDVSVRAVADQDALGIETEAFYARRSPRRSTSKSSVTRTIPFTAAPSRRCIAAGCGRCATSSDTAAPRTQPKPSEPRSRGGSAAVDIVFDVVSTQGLDPDHPVCATSRT